MLPSGLSGTLCGKLRRRRRQKRRERRRRRRRGRVLGRVVAVGRRERQTTQILERAPVLEVVMVMVMVVVLLRKLTAATLVARRENSIRKILLALIVLRELVWSNSI